MNIKDRILQYLEYKGITPYRFSKDTGIANGYLDKKTTVSSEKCARICECYPDLSVEWLIMEKGEMIRKDDTAPDENDGKCKKCEDLIEEVDRFKRVIDEQSELIRLLRLQEAPAVKGQKRKAS